MNPATLTGSSSVPASRWPAMLLFLAIFLALPRGATGNELRPSLLELEEQADGLVRVSWRIALAQGAPLPLSLEMPPGCPATSEPRISGTLDHRQEEWTVDCGPAGLEGKSLQVDGLDKTHTDVLVKVLREDAVRSSAVLSGTNSSWTVAIAENPAGSPEGTWEHLWLGGKALLLAPRHVLVLAGLFLLSASTRGLLARTMLAFALGSTVTFQLAAHGFLPLRLQALDGPMALSVLYLATELDRRAEPADSFAFRRPAHLALGLGLINGPELLGALDGIRARGDDHFLLLFNLGAELGLSILGLLAFLLLRVASSLHQAGNAPSPGAFSYRMPVCSMAVVSAYWVIRDLAAMLKGI